MGQMDYEKAVIDVLEAFGHDPAVALKEVRGREALDRAAAALRVAVGGDQAAWEGMCEEVEEMRSERDRLIDDAASAEDRLEAARKKADEQARRILDATGQVVHARHEDCAAAGCGCMNLTPEGAVAALREETQSLRKQVNGLTAGDPDLYLGIVAAFKAVVLKYHREHLASGDHAHAHNCLIMAARCNRMEDAARALKGQAPPAADPGSAEECRALREQVEALTDALRTAGVADEAAEVMHVPARAGLSSHGIPDRPESWIVVKRFGNRALYLHRDLRWHGGTNPEREGGGYFATQKEAADALAKLTG